MRWDIRHVADIFDEEVILGRLRQTHEASIRPLDGALTFATRVRPAPRSLSFDARLNAAALADGLGIL